LIDPNTGRWLAVNERLAVFLEYSEAELLDKTWMVLTAPDDLGGELKMVEKCRIGQSHGFESAKKYITKSGLMRWAIQRIQVVGPADTTGYPIGPPVVFLSTILPTEIASFRQDGTTKQEAVLKTSMVSFIQANWKWMVGISMPAVAAAFIGFHKYMTVIERLDEWDRRVRAGEVELHQPKSKDLPPE
jgi:hypothetical protein